MAKYKKVKVFVVFVFVLAFCDVSMAQTYLLGGINYAGVRNNIVIDNKEPIIGFNLGISFKNQLFKSIDRLSVINEFKFYQKGYQVSGHQKYPFRLFYITLPVVSEYSISQRVSINAGLEPAYLLFTNVMQGSKTYNRFDIGLITGVNYEINNWLSVFSLFSYGLLPILDYHSIDEMGNFGDDIHDLENICLSVGLKFNVRHK